MVSPVPVHLSITVPQLKSLSLAGATMAQVNREVAPLDTPLKSGDVIEIVTDKNRKLPNEDWLRFVKTHHAREKIKDALRVTKRSFIAKMLGRS